MSAIAPTGHARRVLLTAALLTGSPSLLPAQSAPELGVASGFSSGNGAQCLHAVTATADARYLGGLLTVLPAPLTNAGGRLETPAVALAWRSPAQHRWRVSAAGAVGPSNTDCAMLSAHSRARVTLSRRIGRGGVQLSAAARSLSWLDPARDQQGIAVDLWRTFGPARLEIGARSYTQSAWDHEITTRPERRQIGSRRNDTMPGGWEPEWAWENVSDTTPVRHQTRPFDLRTRLHWQTGRLTLDFTAGGTVDSTTRFDASRPPDSAGMIPLDIRVAPSMRRLMRPWGRVDARVALSSTVAMHVGAAALPPQPVFGNMSRRMVMLGLGVNGIGRRATPRIAERDDGSAAFAVTRDDPSHIVVRLHVPHARTVELSGELSGWEPVAMRQAADGWWTTRLPASPGSYRVNVRVNGGQWSAPPGVPVVRDEFDGEVGIVTVR